MLTNRLTEDAAAFKDRTPPVRGSTTATEAFGKEVFTFNSTSSYIYTLSYALFSYKKNIYTWGGDYDLLKLMSRIVWLTADHQELCFNPRRRDFRWQERQFVDLKKKKKKCKNVTVSTMTATNKDITINLTPIPSHPIYIYRYIYINKPKSHCIK